MAYKESEGDRLLIEKLANAQCTNEEIAEEVGCCEKTLRKHFTDLLKKAKKAGLSNLRLAQYEMAVTKKNVTMLIWMGKQLLGQSDHAEITDGDVTVTFTTQAGPPEELRKGKAEVAARLKAAVGDGAAAEDGAKEPDN